MPRLPSPAAFVVLLAGCGSSGISVPDASVVPDGSGVVEPGAPEAGAADAPDASILADGSGVVAPDALDAGAPDAPAVAADVAAAVDVDDLVDGPPEDAGVADAGMALGKLCHELTRGGQPVLLTLEFGVPTAARISGWTGRCAPDRGTPCAVIPAGLVPVRLLEGDHLLTSRNVVLGGGNEYVFQPYIDSTLQVGITGGRIAPGSCSDLDFPPADGGTD